jgi:hypothetical protein
VWVQQLACLPMTGVCVRVCVCVCVRARAHARLWRARPHDCEGRWLRAWRPPPAWPCVTVFACTPVAAAARCLPPLLTTCCAVLCCAVLCCAVLCCAVLCCAVLCCAVLCCAVLRSAVLCAQCPPGKGIKEAGSRALEACAAIGAQRLVKTVVEQMSRWARDA